MKILLFLLITVISMTSVDARQGGNFGLGGVLGSPSGLSMKDWTSGNHAVEGALAFGAYHRYYNDYGWHNDHLFVHLSASYLWHNFSALPVERGQLPLFWGVGGRMLLGDDFALGARGCGGFEYLFPTAPLDIFLELGIIADFLGNVGGDMDLGIGMRYFF